MVVAMTAISEISPITALSTGVISFLSSSVLPLAPGCLSYVSGTSVVTAIRGSPLLPCSTFGTHLERPLRFRIFLALDATAMNAMLDDENPASTFALWNHPSRRAILLW